MLTHIIRNRKALILCAGLLLLGCAESAREDNADAGDELDTETETPETCELGTLDCACAGGGKCNDDLICDETERVCRQRTACDGKTCESGTVCQPIDDVTIECREKCEPGYELNASETACMVQEESTCILGRDHSITLDCETRYRTCEAQDENARCGECYVGYTMASGTCRAVRLCSDLNCERRIRKCIPAGDHQDAKCSECKEGYVQQNGDCVPEKNGQCNSGASGISDKCKQLNRFCVEDAETNSAKCGECIEGYIHNEETGACERILKCDDLSCDLENRTCEPEPNAHCGACLSGTVEDKATGECKKTLTCDDLTCPEGTLCEPSFDNQNAYCYDPHNCADDQLWDPAKRVCVQCPVCGDDEGEADRRWPRLTKGTDRCICMTKPNYFFSDSMDLKIYSCDKDGDGWVRSDAMGALEKDADDPIRMNARCDLRTVRKFVLENRQGETEEVVLGGKAYLFEPPILDDDDLLKTQANTLYGSGETGRRLDAAELNPLTKVCANHTADFNQNGIADVSEAQGNIDAKGDWIETTHFLPMTYFVELFSGWYEETEAGGIYRIREKSTVDESEIIDMIAIGSSEEDAETLWQECPVLKTAAEAAKKDDTGVGLDFIRFQKAGMNLSNQFKCVGVADANVDEPLENAIEVTKEVFDSPCLLSRCFAGEFSTGRPGDESNNPKSPEIGCKIEENADVGQVGWISVDYSAL